ncbi:MAG: peptidase [Pirellulaceae bacterium]|nr:MAG: peptidase [Pirellulaceae bacterium]
MFERAVYRERRAGVQRQLEAGEAFLITSPINVTYLTGFTGDSSYLLLTSTDCLILSDGRYEIQLAEQCPDVPVALRQRSEQIMDYAAAKIREYGPRHLRVEAHVLSHAQYEQLAAIEDLEVVDGHRTVEGLRAIKGAEELECIERAVDIAERAMRSVLPLLNRRHSEREIALRLEHVMQELGASASAFPIIVAAGPRAALPHAEPSSARLGGASLILVDWGATYQGYRSDLTRVWATSRIPTDLERGFEAVSAAQLAAIEALRPGVSTEEVDRAARQVLAEAGLADRFNHGLGHGIGLEIHESPFVGREAVELRPGMVITVEPGVYFPGQGGIRIEDDVLITEDGHRLLSRLPRTLAGNRIELLD